MKHGDNADEIKGIATAIMKQKARCKMEMERRIRWAYLYYTSLSSVNIRNSYVI